MFASRWARPARWPIRPILGFWGSNVYKNGTLPAFDADEPQKLQNLTPNFIFGREIRNRTNI